MVLCVSPWGRKSLDGSEHRAVAARGLDLRIAKPGAQLPEAHKVMLDPRKRLRPPYVVPPVQQLGCPDDGFAGWAFDDAGDNHLSQQQIITAGSKLD